MVINYNIDVHVSGEKLCRIFFMVIGQIDIHIYKLSFFTHLPILNCSFFYKFVNIICFF